MCPSPWQRAFCWIELFGKPERVAISPTQDLGLDAQGEGLRSLIDCGRQSVELRSSPRTIAEIDQDSRKREPLVMPRWIGPKAGKQFDPRGTIILLHQCIVGGCEMLFGRR